MEKNALELYTEVNLTTLSTTGMFFADCEYAADAG